MIEAILFDLAALVESWDADEVTLYPDVPLTLLPLREQCSLGVISRHATAPEVLARVGLSHLFDAVVVVPEKAGQPGKSDFLRALKEMRATAEDTLYVGAALEAGLGAARQAGLKVALLSRGQVPASALPADCLLIHTVEELQALLLES